MGNCWPKPVDVVPPTSNTPPRGILVRFRKNILIFYITIETLVLLQLFKITDF